MQPTFGSGVKLALPAGAVCFNPGCTRLGSHFPIIHFAPPGKIPGQPFPYTLEIPKAACFKCQPGFKPEVFVTEAARANMTAAIVAGGKAEPDYAKLAVTWHPLSDETWAELHGGGEARFWF